LRDGYSPRVGLHGPEGDAELLAELRSHGVRAGVRVHSSRKVKTMPLRRPHGEPEFLDSVAAAHDLASGPARSCEPGSPTGDFGRCRATAAANRNDHYATCVHTLIQARPPVSAAQPVTRPEFEPAHSHRRPNQQSSVHDARSRLRDPNPSALGFTTTRYQGFAKGVSTSYDSDITILDAQLVDASTVTVDLAFNSLQTSANGPDGDTCDNWTLVFKMVQQSDGTWRMDGAQPYNGSTHTSC